MRGGSRRPIGLWLSAVVLTVFVVRVVVPGWPDGFAPFFPDSSSFTAVADRGPFWPRFWFDERPVGFPLVYWLVGRSPRAIVLVQTLIYAGAALALCAAVHRVARSRVVPWVTSVVVVAVVAQPRVALWTTHVLSESLALTTGMAALAAWLLFGHRPTRRSLWLAMVVTCAWVLVRDSHVLPVVVFVLPPLAMARWRWRSADPALRRTLGHVALLGLAVCAYVTVSQDVSERNRYPVLNNVGQRILVDESMTQWFADHGMPLDDAIRGRTGANSFDDEFAMLEKPEFEELREWADGPGQRTQLLSFVRHAGYWTGLLDDELPAILGGDLDDYDVFGVVDRLPARLLWIDGPRSVGQLTALTLLATAGVVVLALRRRRLLALVIGLALVSAHVEMYLSFIGDSVEAHRHLVGPLLRITLTSVVAVALGADALVRSRAEERERLPVTRRDLASASFVSLMTAVVLASFFGNELRAQDYDPQFARTIVERAAAVGGTYYQNGIHNKGPFEMVVYDVARASTSWGSFWFGVSAIVLVIALVVGATTTVTGRRTGAPSTIAVAVGAGVTVHFLLSTSDYAGVLYSRNITSALLAIVWLVALVDRPWSNERLVHRSLIACGALLGLAVQTLLTTVFAAVVVGMFVVVRRGGAQRRRSLVIVAGSSIAVIAAAPVWYSLRGSSDEFWAGWWTYAQFMSSGTGRSLADQIGLGWTQTLGYLRDRPEAVALIAGFVAVTHRQWHRLSVAERQMHITLLAWIGAAWIELVLSQRYSSHYYSIVAVPAALVLAVLAARLAALPRTPARRPSPSLRTWAPSLAVVGVLAVQCVTPFWQGLGVAGRFDGFGDHADRREQSRGGPDRSTRAILDLVSESGDPLLAWTMYPWTYLDQHRVPATRLSWKSFMIGEIYLGRISPDYVLPQTWDWFAQDMQQTDPAAFVTNSDTPLDPTTPFAAFVATRFEQVYAGPQQQVSVRTDLLGELVRPVIGRPWMHLEDPSTAWTTGLGSASSTGSVVGEPLVLDTDGCTRIGGNVLLSSDDRGLGTLVVRLVDVDGSFERVMLAYDGVRAWSASDFVEFESIEVVDQVPDGEPVPFVIVVGARSAALVIDGRIVAAVRLDGAVSVQLDVPVAGVTLTDMRQGPAPAHSGC